MKLINMTVKTVKVLEKYRSITLCGLDLGTYNKNR